MSKKLYLFSSILGAILMAIIAVKLYNEGNTTQMYIAIALLVSFIVRLFLYFRRKPQ